MHLCPLVRLLDKVLCNEKKPQLTIDNLGRIQSEQCRRGNNSWNSGSAVHEVNDPTIFLPCIRREAHSTSNLLPIVSCS